MNCQIDGFVLASLKRVLDYNFIYVLNDGTYHVNYDLRYDFNFAKTSIDSTSIAYYIYDNNIFKDCTNYIDIKKKFVSFHVPHSKNFIGQLRITIIIARTL